ncbi:DSBA oxidoreductase [Trypanosoma theileri]|uniref:DSBA oxidoreductase n=1 Tax=Trypanosoma theileri TaxID=67003 RepID=A0A1X0NS51_9TRYP|nr:DSBA oxidoreductase [Trypanosoma theileri]ORC87517.1 DSBA oxidoreductase [Trypanosoma theileri]
MTKQVVVEVISDVTCPWCWVGKRSIEKAASEQDIPLELHWRPFQLYPEMQSPGPRVVDVLGKKFGSEVVRQWMQLPETIPLNRRSTASDLGLQFSLRGDARTFNTYNCHLLLTYFGERQRDYKLQSDLQEVLFRRTHQEGRNLGVLSELVEATKEVGITREEVQSILGDRDLQNFLDDVLRRTRLHPPRGFNGVPHFTFPNGQIISGSQNLCVFAEVLRKNV